MSKYILKDKKAVKVDDAIEWGQWFATADRKVKRTSHAGGIDVSTVFLGLDYCCEDGAPKLFETMIFGGPHDGYQERCATWEEAERQHAIAEALVLHGEHEK